MAGAGKKKAAAKPRGLSPALARQLSQIVQSNTRLVVTETVESAIQQTLLRIGLVTDSQTAIIEIQKDNAFTRKSRLIWESRPAKIMLTIFAASLSVLGGVSTYAVENWFFGRHG